MVAFAAAARPTSVVWGISTLACRPVLTPWLILLATNPRPIRTKCINLGTSRYYSKQAMGNVNVEGKGGKAYEFTYDNPGVGPDESQVMPGDSGGPSFFLYGGASPALVGVHWFEGTSNNTPLSGEHAGAWIFELHSVGHEIRSEIQNNETVDYGITRAGRL